MTTTDDMQALFAQRAAELAADISKALQEATGRGERIAALLADLGETSPPRRPRLELVKGGKAADDA